MSQAPGNSIDLWEERRRWMPITARYAYFDHAAVAPLPQPAAAALTRWARQSMEQGDVLWSQWARRIEAIRQKAASLVGAQPREIAFVANTTTGIGLVAEGLDWREGDNVVIPDDEFPSNVYPWLNLAARGVATRRAPVGEDLTESLLQACDSRTRLVSFSWVAFASGRRADLAGLASALHRRGVLVFVDAIQGLGVYPLNVAETPIDFFASDGHKWLLGPEGAGLLYVRHEALNFLRPLQVGWNSVVHRHDFDTIDPDWRDEAARYEGGSPNMPGVMALGASLDMLADWGMGPASDAVARRVETLVQWAADRLKGAGASVLSDLTDPRRSGILSFLPPRGQDPIVARQRCLEHHVVLSCRGGRLRISPHAYNNASDIERLATAIGD